MSTKIYNGYRIKSANFSVVSNIVNLLFQEIKKVSDDVILSAIANKYAHCVDDITTLLYTSDDYTKLKFKDLVFNKCMGYDISDYEYDNSIRNVKNSDSLKLNTFLLDAVKFRFKRCMNSMRRDVDFDFNFYCNISTYDNSKTTLLTFYYECEQYGQVLKKFVDDGLLEYYGYWNNTDMPDDVTKQEWSIRQKTWDKTLKNVSFQKRLFEAYDDPLWGLNIDDVLHKIPSRDTRIIKIAKNILIDQKFKELIEPMSDEERRSSSISTYMKASDWYLNDGINKLEEMSKFIYPIVVDINENNFKTHSFTNDDVKNYSPISIPKL